MSKLIVHSHAPDAEGCLVRVTPGDVGWRYVGFEVFRIGELRRSVAGIETCVVVLSGRVDFAAGGETWVGVGRDGVFVGPPVALYVPPGEIGRASCRERV